jgi:hypothetical protein
LWLAAIRLRRPATCRGRAWHLRFSPPRDSPVLLDLLREEDDESVRLFLISALPTGGLTRYEVCCRIESIPAWVGDGGVVPAIGFGDEAVPESNLAPIAMAS